MIDRAMPTDPSVDAWFDAYDNPMKPAVQRVREIILAADPGKLFNQAAQVWNHTFFWSCMTPGGGGDPDGGDVGR